MSSKLINGIKYMYIMNNNDFKKKSLYDNVYFTLIDIFANAESYCDIMASNSYNKQLTNNVCFEDRTDDFRYTNVLDEKDYVEKLLRWLKKFNIHCFEFLEPEQYEPDVNEIDMKKYMNFDEWWFQFEELIRLIENQYNKCCTWEEEDIERDMDRLYELSDDVY